MNINLISKLQKIKRQILPNEKVLLFGSRARGDAGEDSEETLKEAIANFNMEYCHTSANRLYYACYYVANALLIQKGVETKTHAGVIKLEECR